MSALRSTFSAFLLILGMVVSAVALPATWMKTHLLDTDEWTAAVAPLIEEERFQKSLAAHLVETVQSDAQWPGWAVVALEGVAGKAVATDTFAAVWEETVRTSHRHAVEGMRGQGTGIDVDGAVVAIEVRPLFDALVPRLETAGVPGLSALPAPEGTIHLSGTEKVAEGLRAAGVLDRWAWPLAVTAGVLLLLGVVTSRRPALAVGLAGLGVALVAGAELLLWRMFIAERDSWGTPHVNEVVLRALTSSVEPWLVPVVAGGAVVSLLGFVAAALSRSR